jgi:uncharacterized protein DUF3108
MPGRVKTNNGAHHLLRTGRWLIALLVLLSTPQIVPGAQAEPASSDSTLSPLVHFGPGEKMVFNITYGIVVAGEATLEIAGVTEYQGHTCYNIESKTMSNRFFSSIYKVRDKIVSYIDADKLYSRYFYKRLREGDYKKNVEISFDHEAQLARYSNGKEYPTVAGVQDVLSAFYYVRSLDLVPGAEYLVPAHSSRKTYDLKVLVHGRERVKVPAGEWDCLVVEPIIEGEGLFKHEGRLTLYLTDDQNKIPVLIKTKVPVGTIDVELKEYRPGHPLVREAGF